MNAAREAERQKNEAELSRQAALKATRESEELAGPRLRRQQQLAADLDRSKAPRRMRIAARRR